MFQGATKVLHGCNRVLQPKGKSGNRKIEKAENPHEWTRIEVGGRKSEVGPEIKIKITIKVRFVKLCASEGESPSVSGGATRWSSEVKR